VGHDEPDHRAHRACEDEDDHDGLGCAVVPVGLLETQPEAEGGDDLVAADCYHDDQQLFGRGLQPNRHAFENVVDEQADREDQSGRARTRHLHVVVRVPAAGFMGFLLADAHDEGLAFVDHRTNDLILLFLGR